MFDIIDLLIYFTAGGSQRGIRVANYDIDDPNQGTNGSQVQSSHFPRSHRAPNNHNQRVATVSQNYNEKTMLLSSDDELQ